MFKPYLDQQQRQLDQLGDQHRQQRQLLDQQRARLEALQSLAADLARPVSASALYHQNRSGLQGQIGSLLEMQQQETDMATLSCQHSLELMRRQLGRVKGLEQIHDRRTAEQHRQQARREQHVLDDWSARKDPATP